MRYCIIDDEPIAHRIIEGYCAHLPQLEKVGNCYDAFEAMQLINQEQVDLIFLDINMPKLTGFELLKSLSRKPKIIVTSAYEEYALEGYELNISDYLLKPFSLERFLKAINKVADTSQSMQSLKTKQTKISFFLKGDKKTHQIHFDTILFLEAAGNYTKVITTNETIMSHEKISSLENLLSKTDFVRVHKSFIITKDKIKVIEGNRILIDTHWIPIGQTYKQKIKGLISN